MKEIFYVSSFDRAKITPQMYFEIKHDIDSITTAFKNLNQFKN